MKNFSHLFKSNILPQLGKKNLVKPTNVEGLVLDSKTRLPLEGARIAIHLISDDLGRVQVFETHTDNNGYFCGGFLAEEDVFTITPYKDAFVYQGSFTFSQADLGTVECEEIKYGKKQFFTFSLESGLKKPIIADPSTLDTLKNLFYVNFQRFLGWA